MKLDTPTAVSLFEALLGKEAHYSAFVTADDELKIVEKAIKLYKKDSRGRTLDQVRLAVTRGDGAELCVQHFLRKADFSVIKNEIEALNEGYCWDLLIEPPSRIITPLPALLEIKWQSALARDKRPRTCFSISVDEDVDPAKVVGTMISKWKSYDYLIVVQEHEWVFKPWMIVDSAAFDRTRGLFTTERYPGSWMLKDKVAGPTLVKHLFKTPLTMIGA